MVDLKITTNAADCGRWMMGQPKKVTQAAKAALSKTVLQVQHAERIEINRAFTIRKSAFIRNRVKVFQWPKAVDGGLVAVIGIDGRVKGSPLLLAQFEDGGTKMPTQGKRVAVPVTGTKARPTFGKAVPAGMRMERLAMHKNKGGVPVGGRRTFVLPTKGGDYAVFQRGGGVIGKGYDKRMAPIYVLRKNVPLKRRLQFVKVARELAGAQLPVLFNRYLRLYIKP